MALVAVLLLGLGYMVWPFIVGGGQMESFCNALKIGSSGSEIRKAVSDRGYRIALGKEPKGLIHDTRSFGRFTCEVHFKDDRLVSARYFQNN